MNRTYIEEKRLRHVLEIISDGVLNMADLWRECESHTLIDRLKFVSDAFPYCALKGNTLYLDSAASERVNLPYEPFMLLYDKCYKEDLVHRNHPDDPYNITAAFIDDLFIGWEVKFFGSMQAVENFIIQGQGLTSYSLFCNFEKVPLRFGCQEDSIIEYIDFLSFLDKCNQANQTLFVEAQNVFKIMGNKGSRWCICYNNKELRCAAILVTDFKGFTSEEFEDILIKSKHKKYKRVLIKSNEGVSLGYTDSICEDNPFKIELK